MRIQPRSVVICVGLLVLAGIGFWLLARSGEEKVAHNPAVPVRVVAVKQQDVPRFASGIGSVLSLHSVVIRPQVEGVLTRLLVKEGQWVKQGDLLATIDDRAIRATLEQAKAQLGQSQAQLQVAGVDLKRYKLLSTDNGVSRQTLDQQQALFNQLQATVLGNQAAIAAAQVQLSYTQILSPVTGRVGIRNVDEGNFLRVADTQGLFSVTQIDPIGVEFSLPQNMLPTLQGLLKAQPAAVVQAYLEGDGDNSGTLLAAGHLTLIDNQVAANSGTIRVKAEFANPDARLWPGQLVTLKLQTALEQNALVVPPQVVQRGIDGHYVYKLVGDKVESVPVTVVYQDSTLNIIAGVGKGDKLVSDGQSRLRPGATVEVADQTAAPEEVAKRREQP
ncbi:efflux RND transporter periplasmic adaptor subunit [Pseudomonas sp. P66]|jgi:RND family efflux transporter MFP subunit|uniref:Efflux RND transporter periplasmic adaptor subunit n=1 Tax=Pseudomonas arcuscaelestis TaxID=2710591 RepID=A0ABS2C512_9PSED|nr:efflux RND transporter periplasmic adaptor subunit [Pseudomonas arcuscaelestis]MBM3111428.1 efflux RND transporter periplasmic adaptor subunit [Pseudomonas arcuscaelestis]MBM5460326.1 efflux RND transporter periplasmic adaptor subunit [Pseudomonas arcuscaelestis]